MRSQYVQAAPEFEAIDDEMAMEAAFELGWDGTGLDILLASWLGQKWAVMTVICRYSSRLKGGGLTLQQGQLLLERLDTRGAAGNKELAVALSKARFQPGVGDAAEREIREGATRLLEEREKLW